MFCCLCTAEGSTCVLLCLAEPVNEVERAILASLMDMVGLEQSNSDLTQLDSLKLLQSSQETHLLQLLTPKIEAQTNTVAHAAVSAVKVQTKYIISVFCLRFACLRVCFFPRLQVLP